VGGMLTPVFGFKHGFASSTIKSTPKLADSLEGATQNTISYTINLTAFGGTFRQDNRINRIFNIKLYSEKVGD
jgi:hypothetical protein